MSLPGHDGPFVLLVEHESQGTLFFGPFRVYDRALKMAERIERIVAEVDWSIEALQPGSYAPEWGRIIAEDCAAAGEGS